MSLFFNALGTADCISCLHQNLVSSVHLAQKCNPLPLPTGLYLQSDRRRKPLLQRETTPALKTHSKLELVF